MDFISSKHTLDLLNIFSENISGLQNMLSSIASSNDKLEYDLEKLCKKLVVIVKN